MHGVDVAAIAARPPGERGRIRAELGFADDDVVIGTVANFRAQKDYPNLLAAAAELVARGVDFRLVAVGQGPLEQEITRQRDELGLRDHVVLAGFRPDAVAVMAAADVFVLASAWEGLPVAVMEALALGLPIVATDVGGVAESLDATHAVLVPPRDPVALADALQDLIEHPDRRAELAAGARAAADRFDISRATETVTATYESVTRPAPRPPSGRDASLGGERPGNGTDAAQKTGAGRRRRAIAGDIRPATAADREAIVALLGASLGWGDDDRYRALYAWKHETNPFGPSPAWVVDDGGDVVAVRLFMRWEFCRGGRRLRAVRAVDTATHPSHQGKGLFTALTLHALEACRADGVDFVFNTPNEQSRPGYLKMGWREVGRLPAAMRADARPATWPRWRAAGPRPNAGRCRSTSASTSPGGSTPGDGTSCTATPRCPTPSGRSRRRRRRRSCGGATGSPTSPTASSTAARPPSSSASAGAAPGPSWSSPNGWATNWPPTAWPPARCATSAPATPCASGPGRPRRLRAAAGGGADPHVARRQRRRSATAAQLGSAAARHRALLTGATRPAARCSPQRWSQFAPSSVPMATMPMPDRRLNTACGREVADQNGRRERNRGVRRTPRT